MDHFVPAQTKGGFSQVNLGRDLAPQDFAGPAQSTLLIRLIGIRNPRFRINQQERAVQRNSPEPPAVCPTDRVHLLEILQRLAGRNRILAPRALTLRTGVLPGEWSGRFFS